MSGQANPAKGIQVAKPLYKLGGSLNFFAQCIDTSVTPNTTRDFISVQEALDYSANSNALVQAQNRAGGYEVFINSTGTLANGLITGGERVAYWFKDGVNLVAKGAAATGGYSLFFQNPQLQFQDYFKTAQAIKTILLKSGVATYQYSLDNGTTWVTPTLPLAANIAISADTIVTHKITYAVGVVTALVYIELA